MSIKLVNYSNPYTIDKIEAWKNSKLKLHLCASIGIKNGLIKCFDTSEVIVLTIQELLAELYKEWSVNSIKYIDQYIMLSEFKYNNALRFNRENVLDALRLLVELEISPSDLEELDLERYKKNFDDIDFINMYKEFYKDNKIEVNFIYDLEKSLKILLENNEDSKGLLEDILPIDTIYVHGLYTFTPLINKFFNECLREDINITFMNNYVSEFSFMFDTWRKIYSRINGLEVDFKDVKSYKSQNKDYYKLVSFIQSLSNQGQVSGGMNKLKLTSYANIFEYAQYINNEENKEVNFTINKEVQKVIGVENNSFNHIGGKGLGIIINSFYNLINVINGKIVLVYDISLLKQITFNYERVFNEGSKLFDTLSKVEFFIRDCTRLEEVKDRIEYLIKQKDRIDLEGFNGFDFWNIEAKRLNTLNSFINKMIIVYEELFSETCEAVDLINFKKHYAKLKMLLLKLREHSADEIIIAQFENLLKRIDGTYNSDINECTIDDIKYSIKYYLNPISEEGEESENSLVRGIDNVEGGIWSLENDEIIHFGYLSNEHLNKTREGSIPWPLNIELLKEINQVNKGIFNKEIYITSLEEYPSFIKYSFYYGLIHTKNDIKLSYIRQIGDNKYTPFYILNFLNIEEKYTPMINQKVENVNVLEEYQSKIGRIDISRLDTYKFKFCEHRYFLEKILSNIEASTFEGEYLTILYCERIITQFTLEWCSKDIRKSKEITSHINYLAERMINVIPAIKKFIDLYDVRERCDEYILNEEEYKKQSGNKVKNYTEELFRNFLKIKVKDKEIWNTKNIYKDIYSYMRGSNLLKDNNVCSDCPKQYVCLRRFV